MTQQTPAPLASGDEIEQRVGEIEQLVAVYGDAAFRCGEWTRDEDDSYIARVQQKEVIGQHLMQAIRAALSSQGPDAATGELPYAAVSHSQPEGRAMEWAGPLWDAIHEFCEATPTTRGPAVKRVTDAVHAAMRLAVETALADSLRAPKARRCAKCGSTKLTAYTAGGSTVLECDDCDEPVDLRADSLRAGGTEAGEKDRRDAARWRAVARTLHACSTGPHDGYYMTTEEFVGGRFPTAEEYADRLIAASSPSEAPTTANREDTRRGQ